jgi:hypothetical protein
LQDVLHLREPDLDATYDDRDIDSTFRQKAELAYMNKLLPTASLNKEVGTNTAAPAPAAPRSR